MVFYDLHALFQGFLTRLSLSLFVAQLRYHMKCLVLGFYGLAMLAMLSCHLDMAQSLRDIAGQGSP